MEVKKISKNKKELQALCATVKRLIYMKDYQKCEQLIYEAAGKYPHAPEPHNLIGILFEEMGDHVTAMKHFRAAWALDPTYIPARKNLDSFGTFFSQGKYAFDESDCRSEMEDEFIINYDANGIGHVVRRY